MYRRQPFYQTVHILGLKTGIRPLDQMCSMLFLYWSKVGRRKPRRLNCVAD